MARAKKTSPPAPSAPTPKRRAPKHGLTVDQLTEMNRRNGAPIYDGVQDLIVKVSPSAVSNRDVRHPVKVDGQLWSIKDICLALEVKHPYQSEELWKCYKKFGDKVGCSVFTQMAILEIEDSEV